MQRNQARCPRFSFGWVLAAAIVAWPVAAQAPSREYIRLGGRVIAIESPTTTGGGNIPLTINTDPPGLRVSVNSVSEVAPFTRNVTAGQVTVASEAVQLGSTSGERFKFLNWTGLGTSTQITTNITQATTLTANYT